MRHIVFMLQVVFATYLSCPIAWSQGQYGGVMGRITDPADAVIPGAEIRARNLDTGEIQTAVSTTEGIYSLRSLRPGQYEITATKTGFKVTETRLIVSTATISTVNLTLAVGDVSQSVTVGSALTHLETSNAELGTVVSTKQMDDLPISLGGASTTGATGRRQVENFIFLSAGVTGNQWTKYINGAPAFSQKADRRH